ncbi:MAG: hypothetical protein PHX87_01145 [Candidatus Peribacteraceae bacterium]|nr:hypothetical protein [Candidatus Peribacteraceae bacterium]MDD5742015.1 hypothetical protein [Candidatus Peribacteraceae bacterium]
MLLVTDVAAVYRRNVFIGKRRPAISSSTLAAERSKSDFTLVELWHLSRWYPHYYSFGLDNCLRSLTVNGILQTIPQDFCDYRHENVLDLGPALHAGTNLLRLTINSGGGPAGANILVADYEPFLCVGARLSLEVVAKAGCENLASTLFAAGCRLHCQKQHASAARGRDSLSAGDEWFDLEEQISIPAACSVQRAQ